MDKILGKIKDLIEKETEEEVLRDIIATSCEKLSEISPENNEEQLLLICNFISPNNVRVISKLANIYYKKNDLVKSLSLAKKAVYLTNGESITSLMNAAIIATDTDQRDFAKETFQKVLQLDPSNSRAKFGLGIESFKDKKYCDGWELYLQRHAAFSTVDRESKKTKLLERWDGKSEGDVYFYNEQGYGDLIFSLRFWHHLDNKKNNISFVLDKNISALFESTKYSKLINKKLKNPKYKCSVLDIPALFQDCNFNAEKYQSIFNQHRAKKRKKPKIGITFCGGSTYAADMRRSVHLCFFKELITDPNYDFFIFQKEYKNSKFFDKSCTCKEYPTKLSDYKITADCLLDMDALITIDSSVAHLGGALGVPTFVLLEQVPDFRWYPYKNNMPWYNSWVPIRQANRCDWPSAIKKLKKKLSKYFNQSPDRRM
jgi:tetratricopeptide (TPR) repeat protein